MMKKQTTHTDTVASTVSEEVQCLHKALSYARHYLPEQAPLHAFVHHNTLHAFEEQPFKEAVISAGEMFQAQPFMRSAQYYGAFKNARILIEDIQHVVAQEIDNAEQEFYPKGPSKKDYLIWRLTHHFDVPNAHALNWWLQEKGLLYKPHPLFSSASSLSNSAIYTQYKKSPAEGELAKLWQLLQEATPTRSQLRTVPRLRDACLHQCQHDTDELVHPLLIRLSAAFLDQGIANQALPLREKGFLSAVINYFGTPLAPNARWTKTACSLFKEFGKQRCTAEQVIIVLLHKMQLPSDAWQQTIHTTLQSLKGWAGMFAQLEQHPEKAPFTRLPAQLVEFLAVQLTLDYSAALFMRKSAGFNTNHWQCATYQTPSDHCAASAITFEAFIAAQAFCLTAAQLRYRKNAVLWVKALAEVNDIERRYLMQLAFEHRHRLQVLDAMTLHQRKLTTQQPTQSLTLPKLQAIFCMDEREESTRRHLEEIYPETETFGCPGFFGIPMVYKGFDDAHARPLCPVSITPKHYVEEIPEIEGSDAKYKKKRYRRGKAKAFFQQGKLKLLTSPIWTLSTGAIHLTSLLGYGWLPKVAQAAEHKLHSAHKHKPSTTLRLIRQSDESTTDGLLRGFSIPEAIDIVEGLLRSMGLTQHFAPIVLVVGHGSCSLNNPHEAAHDCGATGGGRGGPNARAFAMLANMRTVRIGLAKRGIVIPETSRFIGAYHNTADDSIEFYDTRRTPKVLKGLLKEAHSAVEQACMLSAQERCRKFEDAPADVSAKQALNIVQRHAADLAQPRPEYGHATNAICIIGERDKTKNLFLDRRAFLISYTPKQDTDGSIVASILQSAGPVGAGINLEYYFSFVDPSVYGCGTKLPHNISGLLGVMNGHASDLRTGLPWQMVEIHEPVRLLTIVQTTKERLQHIVETYPAVARLVLNQWIQLVAWHPETGEFEYFNQGKFEPHQTSINHLPTVSNSHNYFTGISDYLGCAHIDKNAG